MTRKKQFTIDRHVELADELYRMRAVAMSYIEKLSKAYGKTSHQVSHLRKLLKSIDSLRCEMDNVFYREYPGDQFRKPHYEWVHTPYYNSKTHPQNPQNESEQNNE